MTFICFDRAWRSNKLTSPQPSEKSLSSKGNVEDYSLNILMPMKFCRDSKIKLVFLWLTCEVIFGDLNDFFFIKETKTNTRSLPSTCWKDERIVEAKKNVLRWETCKWIIPASFPVILNYTHGYRWRTRQYLSNVLSRDCASWQNQNMSQRNTKDCQKIR